MPAANGLSPTPRAIAMIAASTLPICRSIQAGLRWSSHASNPMRLSPGERRLMQLCAQGARAGELATRMAISIEALGRRVGNVYRKLSWDVRSGSLSLLAA